MIPLFILSAETSTEAGFTSKTTSRNATTSFNPSKPTTTQTNAVSANMKTTTYDFLRFKNV